MGGLTPAFQSIYPVGERMPFVVEGVVRGPAGSALEYPDVLFQKLFDLGKLSRAEVDVRYVDFAGALGKPLWLLLPWQSDWRWMQQTLTTPWYPTARLFRQSSPNNWPELLHRVAAELSL